MNAIVRLKAYRVGPKGGRKLEASRIVPARSAVSDAADWTIELERRTGSRFAVTIQDGNIRPRV